MPNFWQGLAPQICKKIKCFVLWLSVPHGTSNFVFPKMIIHNRSHGTALFSLVQCMECSLNLGPCYLPTLIFLGQHFQNLFSFKMASNWLKYFGNPQTFNVHSILWMKHLNNNVKLWNFQYLAFLQPFCPSWPWKSNWRYCWNF